MKARDYMAEIIVGLVLIIISLLLLNQEMLLMPQSIDMLVLVGLIVAFLVFFGLIWKESTKDEREYLHSLQAGRKAFLVGIVILVIGIVNQSLNHNIDPWLLYGLIGMLFVKIGSRIYSQLKH